MRSKFFVATLLVAAAMMAGAAEAQAPDVLRGTLKSEQVKVFNIVFDTTDIVSIEFIFRQANIDGDIILIDDAATRQARDADDENAFAVFNSTVKAYEAATVSRVAGSTVTICLVHESGSNSKYTMLASSKGGSGVGQGAARSRGGFSISEAGEFDLHGAVAPGMARLQEIVQQVRAAKR